MFRRSCGAIAGCCSSGRRALDSGYEVPDVPDFDRRDFLKTAALAGLASAAPAASAGQPPETVVASLYKSLTAAQRTAVCFDFADPLRSKVDNNWFITPQRIRDFYTPEQQAMIEEIFRGLHNPEFVPNVMKHIKEDAGGLGAYSIALFGAPGTGKFEFVLTGRHCTVRCDGDSVDGYAFGGPIFYGHAAGTDNEKPDHPGNVYWYQAKRANEVFQALDGKQREQALISRAPRAERATATVELRPKADLVGLPVAGMSKDQKKLVEQVLTDLLMPFRKKDADEAMKLIRKNGGADAMSLSFYKNMDVGGDGVWDVWQVESPTMMWYFRGMPHVHTWVNIKDA
ncbi:MAG: DUF3500 domain-containing protein [Acidobacteria bacterium]|nr:DUF3500 domain-containing protein [Acidobacteriota bacterium]